MADFFVNTDGGSRGNPGPAAIGIVVYDGDKPVVERKRTIGVATNNQAEYRALLWAVHLVEAVATLGDTVTFRLDSELVVKQMRGEYRIKDADLSILKQQVEQALGDADFTATFTHVPRAQNKAADKLVNDALDGK